MRLYVDYWIWLFAQENKDKSRLVFDIQVPNVVVYLSQIDVHSRWLRAAY